MPTTEFQPAYVFVDDSDDGFEYGGGKEDWLYVTQTTSLFAPETRPPWYDTLHVQLTPNSEAFMAYDFNGTFVSAHLATVLAEGAMEPPNTPIRNCTLDGKLLELVTKHYSGPNPESGALATCFPGKDSGLGAGSHRLEVFSSGSPGWGFDGLFYIPLNIEEVKNTTDLVYPIQRNLTTAGETFDFQFNGTRMALYSVYGTGGITHPVNLSYSIDGGPVINFRSDNISRKDTLTDYLLIQTDRYSYGSHDLHLELGTGSVSVPVLVPLQYAIVQSSAVTAGANLTVVPPTSVGSSTGNTVASAGPTQSSSSARSLGKKPPLGRGTAIYISVPLSAVLIIVLVTAILLRRRRLKSARSHLDKAPNNSRMILPFVGRPSILRLTFDAVDSKNRRRIRVANAADPECTGKRAQGVEYPAAQMVSLASVRSRAPAPPPAPPPPPRQMELTTTPMAPVPAIAPNQPTYRIHEDAGSVRTTTPVPEEEVIDLPPNYSSILSRFRRASRAEGGESNGEGHGSGITHESPEVDEEEVGMAY
ncbi:hypothetical protein CPC08DRAFT_823390 [Agrocybe pediades]|nr:hypothetical protein CPC08DRAFT_823390 [Agrocybe pediades]